MSVINSIPLIAAAGDDGYQISRSVRLRSSASAYFNRTPASAGNRKTWTWSGWAKRGALGSSQTLFSCGTNTTRGRLGLGWMSTDQLNFDFAGVGNFNTTAIYRDPSAWYHIVFTVDSTQASNRGQIWVNNSQVYAANFCNQNEDLPINTAAQHMIGNLTNGSSYFDGYLTDINFIDGQALTPSSFGETDAVTGVWKPKKYTGTYGTNGFYLNFSDPSAATAAAIGKDYSGNGNNWTPNNISVTAGATYDSMLDVPTPYADGGNGRGNYCVMNPLDTASGVFANANLNVSTTSGRARGTIFVGSGKWYWEATITSMPSTTVFGIADTSYKIGTSNDSQSRGYVSTGSKISNGSSSAYGASFTAGDTIGVAYDVDAGTLTFYKNNTSQGTAYSDIAGYSWSPYVQGGFGADFNFGQRPFAYTPPTGFKALNTQNLPEPTIKKGNQYFDATTYTGTGSARSVVNAGGFQPDLVWVKGRSVAYSHLLTDSVRGATKRLVSDSTAAEVTDSDTLTAFNSDGFSWGTGIGGNQNAATYVGWQWKAGGTPAVTNTAGSITSTVSAGVTQGFSVVTYTGTGAVATVGHGLGVAPKMIIAKGRTAGAPNSNWVVYHENVGNNGAVFLNLTAGKITAGYWNNTTPTSANFTLGTADENNRLSIDYVAYCFAEVPGFSRFGSYTGNGSADGPFIHLGFRPRYLMLKNTSITNTRWIVMDTARDGANVAVRVLSPNIPNAEDTSTTYWLADFLSNGVKLRYGADSEFNNSGNTYIYAAFAENPFKNALAR